VILRRRGDGRFLSSSLTSRVLRRCASRNDKLLPCHCEPTGPACSRPEDKLREAISVVQARYLSSVRFAPLALSMEHRHHNGNGAITNKTILASDCGSSFPVPIDHPISRAARARAHCGAGLQWCHPRRLERPSVGSPALAALNVTAVPSRCEAQNVPQFFRELGTSERLFQYLVLSPSAQLARFGVTRHE
jgi:hypothetical protein